MLVPHETKKKKDTPSHAVHEILRAKREWETIFDALSVPVSFHDIDMTVLRANRAFASLIGMDVGDVIGKKCYELLNGGEPLPVCPRQKVLEERVSVTLEARVGERFYNLTLSPVLNEEGEIYAFVHLMDDITAIKLAEERLNEESKVTAALLDVAVAVSSLTGIDEVMKRVSAICRMAFNSMSCLTYSFDRETDSFLPAASSGLSLNAVPFFNTFRIGREDMLLVKGLIRDKKVFTIGNVEESPWIKIEYAKPLGIASMMATPIVSMGEALGLIFVNYGEPRVFTPRELSILHGISQQVSVAVANAGMYQTITNKSMELAHRVETIQAMHEIDMSILSSIERDVILETAVSMVGRVIPCEMGEVSTVNMERREFSHEAGFGFPFHEKPPSPFTDTTATEVVKTGRPQYCQDLWNTGPLLTVEDNLSKAGFRSHIRVPLTVKGEVVGVLSVGSKRPSAFTPDDLSTLERLAGQITVALENSRLVEDLRISNLNIEQTLDATVLSLSKLAEFRDPETGYHLERISHYSRLLAEECTIKRIYPVDEGFIKDISRASVLHDIGKVGVKDSILLKAGKLTDEEFEEMKRHTMMGGQIIEAAEKMVRFRSFLSIGKEVAFYHHEKFDGSGYPKGLKGEEIPISARIVALADFYDALTSHRNYRNWVKSHNDMKVMIIEEAGRHFDPEVVAAFLRRDRDFVEINKRFPDK